MTVARLALIYAPWLAVSAAALAVAARPGAFRWGWARALAGGAAVVMIAYPVGVLLAPRWYALTVWHLPIAGAAASLGLLAAGLAGWWRARSADAVRPPPSPAAVSAGPAANQAADAAGAPTSPAAVSAGPAAGQAAAEPVPNPAQPQTGRGGAGVGTASDAWAALPALAPGGRRGLRRRERTALVRGVQYGSLIGVVVILALVTNWQTVSDRLFTLQGLIQAGPRILPDFLNTIRYTLGAFVVSLTLGTALALMKLSGARLYRGLATAYIEFFRGLPALIVVFAVAYGIPLALGVSIPTISLKAAVALGCVSAAYMAESIRAGIQAVPKGQIEAARSLGLSHGKTLRSVVIPQAFRIVLPPVTNEIILLTKDTSLVYVMGLTVHEWELTKLARETLVVPEGGLTALFAIGACYLVITLPLSFLVRRLERGFGRGKS
ncbi:MAG: amino acid ABC transporter permease [Bifidobacteriaceae bacterium]|jgi:polar amino acid transport system permease protein|nr:amino acid ABC transporter permease [Bifidobacteriaceae bacterium]